MTKTAVIIQARMGSSRLPGKMLLELARRPAISHVLERAQHIAGADVVCCAVPDTADSDALADTVGNSGAVLFRGSEHDVLDRYYRAARHLGADVILRLTGDCPLIDPVLCSAVISLRAETGATYASNCMPAVWPHGLDCEAFPFDWLERAAREATDPLHREHVAPFIRLHPEARHATLPGPGRDLSDHRWTLDTPADLTFLRALFDRLPDGPEGWPYRVPLGIVEADPALAAINLGAGKKNWSDPPAPPVPRSQNT